MTASKASSGGRADKHSRNRAQEGVRGRKAAPSDPGLSSRLTLAIAVLALAGAALASYLTYLYFSGAHAGFCTQGSGCDLVRESEYSQFLGIPVSLLGVFGYLAIAAVAIGPSGASLKRMSLFLLSLAAVAFSAYLAFVQVALIEAVCPYCTASEFISLALLLLSLALKPWRVLPPQRLAMASVGLVALVLLVSPLVPRDLSRTSAVSDDYRVGLAKHLTASGVVVYGAYWCPHCQDQKKQFGDAFKYVNYVECDPSGKDARPQLCQAKGVRGYPTWEVEGRLYSGVISLAELARMTGYQGTT